MRGKPDVRIFDKKKYYVEEIGTMILVRRRKQRNGKKGKQKVE